MREPIQPPRKGQRVLDYLKQIHPAIALWNIFSVSGAAKWDSGTPSLHVGGGGGGGAIVAYTPVGGIPARAGSTLGSAVCEWRSLSLSGSDLEIAAEGSDVTVHNLASGDIGGEVYIIAVRIDGHWVAVWEDCA